MSRSGTLIFHRRDVPGARAAWLLGMSVIACCRLVTETVPPIRRAICESHRQRRKLVRSMCDGCRFCPGDTLRRGERERPDGFRPCLAGELMEFYCGEFMTESQIGWRREGCERRERGDPEPEPQLPPYPWFQFIRHRDGYEIRLRTERGSTNITREVGRGLLSIADARPAAAAWARRQRVPFVEQPKEVRVIP